MKEFNHPILGKMYLVPMLSGAKPTEGMVLMAIEKENGKLTTKSFEVDRLPFKISAKTLKKYGYKAVIQDVTFLADIEKGYKKLYGEGDSYIVVMGDTSEAGIKKAIRHIKDLE